MNEHEKDTEPFSEIEPRAIRLRWQGLPAGTTCAIGGPPGKGKSLVSFRIAADVSQTDHVLVSNIEDLKRETSRPRMAAAGANLDRVHAFEPRLGRLPDSYDRLEAAVRRHNAKLVVLDTAQRHLAPPPGDAAGIQAALDPVEALCEETGCTVLFITHQVKNASPNSDPLSTIGGANAGLIGGCRCAWLVGRNPADNDQFVMTPVKYNLGEWPAPLSFELDVAGGLDKGDDPEAGFLVLRGECGVTGRELVKAQYAEHQDKPKESKSERAAEWLSRYLWAANEPRAPKEVVADAARLDPPITARQLRRAAQELSATDPDGGQTAMWELPTDLREMLDAQYGEENGDDD